MMTDQEILAIKEALHARCQEQIAQRISEAENAIASARNTSAGETKSSAGDKYETTREMMQQEIAQNEAQLLASGKLRYTMQKIRTGFVNNGVQEGSLVYTCKGNFYIAVSLGEIDLSEGKFMAISSLSPLGAKMTGKTAGDVVEISGRSYKIEKVF